MPLPGRVRHGKTFNFVSTHLFHEIFDQLEMLRWCHMSRVFITATQKDKGTREQARGPSSHNFPYTPLFPLSTFIPSFWEMRYNILLIRLPACLAVPACPKRKNREGNSKPQVTEFLTSHHSTNINFLLPTCWTTFDLGSLIN